LSRLKHSIQILSNLICEISASRVDILSSASFAFQIDFTEEIFIYLFMYTPSWSRWQLEPSQLPNPSEDLSGGRQRAPKKGIQVPTQRRLINEII